MTPWPPQVHPYKSPIIEHHHHAIPHPPLKRMAHNLNAKVAHIYSILDDLAQSSTSMSSLEVLQTCPSKKKELLKVWGAVNPLDANLITFDIYQITPRCLSYVSFSIHITIKNICIYQSIINEGHMHHVHQNLEIFRITYLSTVDYYSDIPWQLTFPVTRSLPKCSHFSSWKIGPPRYWSCSCPIRL